MMVVVMMVMTPTSLSPQVRPTALVAVAAVVTVMETATAMATEDPSHLLDRRRVDHQTATAEAVDLLTAAETLIQDRSRPRNLLHQRAQSLN